MEDGILPNIVCVLADDMGYGDVSANNPSCPFRTRSFDRLCEEGLRFVDAHASSAVCTPSRYSLLTGRYNWRSTLKSGVLGGYSEPLIPRSRPTIASILRQRGYRSFCVGKWHLGMSFGKTGAFREEPDFAACSGVDYEAPIANGPLSCGFDGFFGISGSLDMPPYVYIRGDRFTAVPTKTTAGTGKGYWRRGPTADGFVHQDVLQNLTDEALGIIEREKGRPFFLYYALPAPHTPILPFPRLRGKSGTNEYGDFVLSCDDVMGQIDAKLREAGLLDDTIVVLSSDNGCSPAAGFQELKEHGHNPSYVFRGAKADIYEGGHRIPLIVRWPRRIRGGRVSGALVCLSDLMATFADILHIPLPDNAAEDSFSLLPIWEGKAQEVREDLVHQSIDGSLSIRRGRWKLEMCPGSGGWSEPRPGGPDETFLPPLQLYDLQADIGETANVAAAHPAVVASLRALLRRRVLEGRSVPGPPLPNDGAAVWETARWLKEAPPSCLPSPDSVL